MNIYLAVYGISFVFTFIRVMELGYPVQRVDRITFLDSLMFALLAGCTFHQFIALHVSD